MAKLGRPSMGITKKVSLTLPEEVWEKILLEENLSAYLRSLVLDDKVDIESLKIGNKGEETSHGE